MLNDNSKLDWKNINILYFAIIAGQLLFALVVVFMIYSGSVEPDSGEEGGFFGMLVPIVTFSTAVAAYWLNKNQLQKAAQRTYEGVKPALTTYRQAVIFRNVLLEGGNLLALIATLVTGNLNYLLYFAIGIAISVFFRPKQEEFASYFRMR